MQFATGKLLQKFLRLAVPGLNVPQSLEVVCLLSLTRRAAIATISALPLTPGQPSDACFGRKSSNAATGSSTEPQRNCSTYATCSLNPAISARSSFSEASGCQLNFRPPPVQTQPLAGRAIFRLLSSQGRDGHGGASPSGGPEQGNSEQGSKGSADGSGEGSGGGSGGGPEEEFEEPLNEEDPPSDSIAGALERLFLESYRLLDGGHPEHAETLLLEGAASIEEEMGADVPELAQVWDQISLMQFFQDKLPEAEGSARKTLGLALLHFGPESPAAAMAQLRLGATLLGNGKAEEGGPLLEKAYRILEQCFGEGYAAVGEAQFYVALSQLRSAQDADAICAAEDGLLEGLVSMQDNLGAGPRLTEAAMREHNRVLDEALLAEDWGRAEELFLQEIRLHNVLDPNSVQLSLIGYQLATLLYVRGRHEEALEVAKESEAVALRATKPSEDQLMLRKLRIGTILGALGRANEAEELLKLSFEHFKGRLGSNNPVTGEAAAALALSQLSMLNGQLEASEDPFLKVLAPNQRSGFLRRAEEGLEAMRVGYGSDHMLVKKATSELQNYTT